MILKNFSENESNFKDLFADLYVELNSSCFMYEDPIGAKYRLKDGISFKRSCKMIDKFN
jgi:hypothetical protein